MSTRISEHIRSNVVGYVAIFMFAMSGSAYGLSGSNTVFSDDIAPKEVGTADLAVDGVTSPKIDDGAVGTGDIQNGGVGQLDIATGGVTSTKIMDGQVLAQDIGNAQVLNADLGANAVTSTKIMDGQVTNADLAGNVSFWRLGGNFGTTGANFLGTTDNTPLNLRVSNARGLRLEPAFDGSNLSPNVIGGIADNTVTAGVHSATIAGGGRSNPANSATANRVADHRGTVGGGAGNQAGDNDAILSDAASATVGGGQSNTASSQHATIAGGINNTASSLRTTVGGGELNTANATSATVGGGASNSASAIQATVGGGVENNASGDRATVGGGQTNTAKGQDSTVGGGTNNLASGVASTIPGGELNTAAGDYSFAAGRRAANTNDAHRGAFLFADSSDFDFASTAANSFAVRSTGGARFVSAINGTTGAPTAGVTLASGGGSWSSLSDRASKTGVAPVSGREVLDKLSEVPVSTWGYKAQDPSIRHIGPMAQDFARAFGVGESRRSITSIDADGVALAAIKGLNERVEALGGGMPASRGGADASGLSISPAVLAGIAALAMTLAAALGAALALRWSGRGGGRLAAN
jgi:hypothetical protein